MAKRRKQRSPKDSELSDFVFVDRYGRFRFLWDIVGEIEGVFEWDEEIDFYTKYSDGPRGKY
jgi:hypothetical protein